MDARRIDVTLADLGRTALVPLDEQVETQARARTPDAPWQPMPPFGGSGAVPGSRG